MESYDQLQQMTDSHVIERINLIGRAVEPGVSFWMDELNRRAQQGATDRMETLTKDVRTLTVVYTWLAAVSTLSSIAALVVSLKS